MSEANDDVSMQPPSTPNVLAPAPTPANLRKRLHDSSGPSSAGPSQGAQPASSSDTDTPNPLPSKKAKRGGTTPRTQAGLKKEKEKKKRANDWHLTKEEYPITWRITKKCLEIHVRALCLPTNPISRPPSTLACDEMSIISER
ncbi:hypothetical protein GALMADRAFT_155498 [Galerina marginata CBS 339.88]|uniref:Uncharacterized protein n=1 Tax=Galerina marginata (strain CBS 339.88) TaxID=685588 RepID=A0A067T3D0_GALM3|nr:hypothetical protein GALMADRAFT_155498 [Galerina marginata CBS 339.88]